MLGEGRSASVIGEGGWWIVANYDVEVGQGR